MQRMVSGAAPIAFETAIWTHRHSRLSLTMNCFFCSHWVDKSFGIGGLEFYVRNLELNEVKTRQTVFILCEIFPWRYRNNGNRPSGLDKALCWAEISERSIKLILGHKTNPTCGVWLPVSVRRAQSHCDRQCAIACARSAGVEFVADAEATGERAGSAGVSTVLRNQGNIGIPRSTLGIQLNLISATKRSLWSPTMDENNCNRSTFDLPAPITPTISSKVKFRT